MAFKSIKERISKERCTNRTRKPQHAPKIHFRSAVEDTYLEDKNLKLIKNQDKLEIASMEMIFMVTALYLAINESVPKLTIQNMSL